MSEVTEAWNLMEGGRSSCLNRYLREIAQELKSEIQGRSRVKDKDQKD
jgi:hypothetical protein